MTTEGLSARAEGMNGGQGEQLRHAAVGLADQVARTADAQASTTMTKVGETLDQVARAIRQAGESLRDQQPEIAGFAETAATRVEDASTYLRDHDAHEAVATVQDIARQQPALIIGGGLALGIMIGRFLRSGADAGQWGQGGQGMGEPEGSPYRSGVNPRYASGTSGLGYGTAGYGTSYGADVPAGAATPSYTPAGETTSRLGVRSGGTDPEPGHGTALRDTAEPEDIETTLSPGERLPDETPPGERGR